MSAVESHQATWRRLSKAFLMCATEAAAQSSSDVWRERKEDGLVWGSWCCGPCIYTLEMTQSGKNAQPPTCNCIRVSSLSDLGVSIIHLRVCLLRLAQCDMIETAHPEANHGTRDMNALPVNASTINRLTRFAIKVLKRFRKHSGTVSLLSGNICAKYGRSTHLSEAAIIRYVAQHTSTTAPRVRCAFEREGRTYIVIGRVYGEPLSVLDGSNALRRVEGPLLAQLKIYIEEMRRLVSPEGIRLANVDDGMLYDPRLMDPSHLGPFDSIQSFHEYLRGGPDAHPDHTAGNRGTHCQAARRPERPYRALSCYGELSSFKVLAAGDEIVGIVA
jgi:hypothetical protein